MQYTSVSFSPVQPILAYKYKDKILRFTHQTVIKFSTCIECYVSVRFIL